MSRRPQEWDYPAFLTEALRANGRGTGWKPAPAGASALGEVAQFDIPAEPGP